MYLIQPIDKHGTSYSFSVFSAGAHDLQQAQNTTPRVNGERRRTSTLLHVIKPSSSCRHLFLTLQLQLNQPSHHTKRNTEPHAPKTLASRPRQIYLIHYNTHGTRTRIRVWTCTPCAQTGTVHTYPWPSFSPHPNSLTPVQIDTYLTSTGRVRISSLFRRIVTIFFILRSAAKRRGALSSDIQYLKRQNPGPERSCHATPLDSLTSRLTNLLQSKQPESIDQPSQEYKRK